MCYRHGIISFNRPCPACGAPQCNELFQGGARRILRRVEETAKDKSVETVDSADYQV